MGLRPRWEEGQLLALPLPPIPLELDSPCHGGHRCLPTLWCSGDEPCRMRGLVVPGPACLHPCPPCHSQPLPSTRLIIRWVNWLRYGSPPITVTFLRCAVQWIFIHTLAQPLLQPALEFRSISTDPRKKPCARWSRCRAPPDPTSHSPACRLCGSAWSRVCDFPRSSEQSGCCAG